MQSSPTVEITINITLLDYQGLVQDTFVYLGIFHSNSEFQTQFDNTIFNIGEKESIAPPQMVRLEGGFQPMYFWRWCVRAAD